MKFAAEVYERGYRVYLVSAGGKAGKRASVRTLVRDAVLQEHHGRATIVNAMAREAELNLLDKVSRACGISREALERTIDTMVAGVETVCFSLHALERDKVKESA